MGHRWCIPIDHLKILYFQIPKSANTSILFSLGQISEWEDFPKMESFDINKKPGIQQIVKKYKIDYSNKMAEKYKDYYKFTFVRNPYDRAVSCWNDKVRNKKDGFNAFAAWQLNNRNISFEEYCKKISKINDVEANDHFRSQSYCVFLGSEMVLDWYGKIEQKDDWQMLQEKLWKDNRVDLPDLLKLNNKVDKDHYSCYYNSYIKNIIDKRYDIDFKTFGYDKIISNRK